jgi:hypothetical protein
MRKLIVLRPYNSRQERTAAARPPLRRKSRYADNASMDSLEL